MGTFLSERSCSSMKRINTVGRLAKPMEMRIAPSRQAHTVMSTPKTEASYISCDGHSAQSIRASSHQIDGRRQIGGFESPSRHFRVSPVLGIREELKDLSISDRDFHALGTIYEPLLGENRELGEKRDSTLRTNPRLI